MNTFLKIAYQPYKWFIVIPFVVFITMLLGLICIVIGFIFSQDAADVLAVTWSRLCCAIAPLKVIIQGQENYHHHHCYVVVANHQSIADIPIIHGFIGLKIKWVIKKELEKIPIFGLACRQLGCIFIDRSNQKTAILSIQTAKKKLSRKASVLFFAEGTRSRDGKLRPFKKGAFIFAMETGLPILPITIKDSFKVLAADSLDLTPGSVEMIAHPPIHITPQDADRLDEIMENTRRIISRAL
ncbi:MAG: 1-acyl-sn-glycerol-3-phosphate acyltransferase [Desulfobacteraceae bacterium]|nr:1-acyl-sn-glycerol-3-phosphate acyltransferase [Desulfobacteraceae bacterium]